MKKHETNNFLNIIGVTGSSILGAAKKPVKSDDQLLNEAIALAEDEKAQLASATAASSSDTSLITASIKSQVINAKYRLALRSASRPNRGQECVALDFRRIEFPEPAHLKLLGKETRVCVNCCFKKQLYNFLSGDDICKECNKLLA